jgi:hypothetical protein
MMKAAKRVALEVVGWVLLLAGLAALVLPGPGLLLTAAGLIVLSQQYEWAERRLAPVKREALRGAANSVQTWPRIGLTLFGIAWLTGFGILWIVGPGVPDWWPLPDGLWLLGGDGTGITLVVSAVVALGLFVWSWRTYRNDPEAVARVTAAAKADDDREHLLGS